MPRQKLDKETRKVLLNARKLIEAVAKADGNEAETRKRVDRIFETVMGYDTFKHITREHAVHGVGDTEYCDFAIQLDNKESSVPIILVELKRVNIDLMPKHLKQVSSYAVNMGCEWVLLTNGKEWKLYHISFTQPPQTKLVDSWNLINDDPVILAKKFNLIGYRNIKKGGLAQLWVKANVLTAQNILKVVLSKDSIRLIRREIKKATDSKNLRVLSGEVGEMEKIKISLPEKKQRKRTTILKSSKEKEEPSTNES